MKLSSLSLALALDMTLHHASFMCCKNKCNDKRNTLSCMRLCKLCKPWVPWGARVQEADLQAPELEPNTLVKGSRHQEGRLTRRQ
jgi:hypothetical protein